LNGCEKTATEVHATLCGLVSAEASKHSAWADYSAVLLDPETAAFFAARLGKGAAASKSSQPSKKRKLHDESGGAAEGAADENIALCEHCGGAVPKISIRVACLDGSSLDLTVPQRELVREIKRAVAQVREMDPGLIDFFVKDTEDALPDAGRLHGLGLGDGSVLFMLQRLGWRWDVCGGKTALSEDGLVATMVSGVDAKQPPAPGDDELHKAIGAMGGRWWKCLCGQPIYLNEPRPTDPLIKCWECNEIVPVSCQLVTSGLLMTEGRHYWEVEVKVSEEAGCDTMLGAMRPGLEHDATQFCVVRTDAYLISSFNGSINGNGQMNAHQQGAAFVAGDRVGVLLDLDAGWLRFYLNGRRCGPGFSEGVTGPLVRGAALFNPNNANKVTVAVTALPGAVAPADADGG
jgi:hypothetical protein